MNLETIALIAKLVTGDVTGEELEQPRPIVTSPAEKNPETSSFFKVDMHEDPKPATCEPEVKTKKVFIREKREGYGITADGEIPDSSDGSNYGPIQIKVNGNKGETTFIAGKDYTIRGYPDETLFVSGDCLTKLGTDYEEGDRSVRLRIEQPGNCDLEIDASRTRRGNRVSRERGLNITTITVPYDDEEIGKHPGKPLPVDDDEAIVKVETPIPPVEPTEDDGPGNKIEKPEPFVPVTPRTPKKKRVAMSADIGGSFINPHHRGDGTVQDFRGFGGDAVLAMYINPDNQKIVAAPYMGYGFRQILESVEKGRGVKLGDALEHRAIAGIALQVGDKEDHIAFNFGAMTKFLRQRGVIPVDGNYFEGFIDMKLHLDNLLYDSEKGGVGLRVNAEGSVAQETRTVDGDSSQLPAGVNYKGGVLIPFRVGPKNKSFRGAVGFEQSGLMDVTRRLGAKNPSMSYAIPVEVGGQTDEHTYNLVGVVPLTDRSNAEAGFRYFNDKAKIGFGIDYRRAATSSAREDVLGLNLILGSKDSNPSMIPTKKLRGPSPQ